tara:strand:- start:413 stop:577 length:165 start_codon:yes stop_codon:yes gene_type:complete
MLETVFKNQVLMTFVIGLAWVIPGILFAFATKRKIKEQQIENRLKKISKLYPQQ